MKMIKLITSHLFALLFLFALVFSISSCTSDKKAEDSSGDTDMEQMEEKDAKAENNKGSMADGTKGTADGASGKKEKSADKSDAMAYDDDADHSENIGVVAVPYHATTKPIPKEKIEAVEYSEEPMVIAEHWPYYGDCANLQSDAAEKRKCSNQAFLKRVSSMLQYPEEARTNGAEGKVVVELIIDENGNVSSSKVVNDLVGYGADEEALRVVNAAGNWTPAEHKGKPVKFKMLLPIDFRLTE